MEASNNSELLAVLVVDSRRDRNLSTLVRAEQPACLLPLCNVTLLEFALYQLERGGVTEILVSVISNKQAYVAAISRFLETSRVSERGRARKTLLAAGTRGFSSVGEVLRELDSRESLRPKKEFIIVDVLSVSNANYRVIAAEHRSRHEADSSWTATCLFFRHSSMPFINRHGHGVLVGVDANSNQLLLYNPSIDAGSCLFIKNHVWGERDCLRLQTGLCDCLCDILSPEVLIEFRENFDYEELRDYMRNKIESDFMEVTGNRIYYLDLSERGEYCRCVHDVSSYFQVAKDFAHGWLGSPAQTHELREAGLPVKNLLSRSAEKRPSIESWGPEISHQVENSVAASNSTVWADSRVIDCVISAGVHVSEQCYIENTILLDECVVEKGCIIRDAILCRNTRIMKGARIDGGCVVGPDVVVSEGAHIPEGHVIFKPQTRVSESPTESAGSESEDTSSQDGSRPDDVLGDLDESASDRSVHSPVLLSKIGHDWRSRGVGERNHSSLYRCEKRFLRGLRNPFEYCFTLEDELESVLSTSNESESPTSFSEDECEVTRAELAEQECTDSPFKRELAETILRAVRNDNTADDTAVELSSLRLAYDRLPEDIVGEILATLVRESPLNRGDANAHAIHALRSSLFRWKSLIQRFASTKEAKMRILDHSAACSVREMLPTNFFSYLVQLLYEVDLLEERILFEWAQMGTETIGTRAHISTSRAEKLLAELEPFLKWLAEAEEEQE
ncbi:hypothetical protein CCYA_CCYA16G4125 [Cyanidiococcus yangmingshanensis]|nr:hypothetical protein CCYA_CCYA16G4125 [Cyanidiococcus yangmingshanensis]